MSESRDTEPTDHPADPGYGLADETHPLDGDDRRQDTTTVTPVADTGKRPTRSVGANRHLTSLVLAIVAVPAGYGFLDYGVYRAARFVQQTPSERLPDRLIIMLGAAAACFLLAGLAGRISAMGPAVAGLLWGAAPAAWVILDYPSFVDRLNDLPEFWNNTGFGLAGVSFAVFPAVTGLLLAGVITGRWRRPVPVSRW